MANTIVRDVAHTCDDVCAVIIDAKPVTVQDARCILAANAAQGF